MILGNPYTFAIGWLDVSEWKSGASSSELFYIYAGGRLVAGEKAEPHYVAAQLSYLESALEQHAMQKNIPAEIVTQGDAEVFKWLHDITFIEVDDGREECYSYLAAPYAILDKHQALFLVRNPASDVIYHGYSNPNVGKLIQATVLPVGEYSKVVRLAAAAYKKDASN